MAFGYKIREKFIDEVAIPPNELLDEVVEWCRNNLEPEDVFDTRQLEDWAFENNYQKFD